MHMLRSTFLVLSLAIIHITTAQLAPERPATTGEHLLEAGPLPDRHLQQRAPRQ